MNSPTIGRARHVISTLVLAALASGCAHRSVAVTKGVIACGADVKKIRIEMANGTLDLATLAPGAAVDEINWTGGVRRDASSAEGLQKIEDVSVDLSWAMDLKDPGTLVVKCPSAPSGVVGMIAYEGNIRIPATMPVEVLVSDNGHITMVGREAFSKVRTGRGDLRFERCKGGIEANTGQGVLIAFDHEGDIDVRTGLGDMQVFINKLGDRVTLGTGQGTVQCKIPAASEFEVDARAEIGKIGNDFDFEVRREGEYSAAMTGKRGSGKTKVILRTASGHISMRNDSK
jgi:hypothetical protein